jgi:hypothetical protein
LSSIGTDVEIDEATTRRTLCEGAEKIRLSVFSFFDADGKFEPQILLRKSLPLNGLVIVPVTFLHTEINPTRRPFNDYAKRYLSFHGNAAYISSNNFSDWVLLRIRDLRSNDKNYLAVTQLLDELIHLVR